MYKNHIRFPALYSQSDNSDYLDKLETHQVTCRGSKSFVSFIRLFYLRREINDCFIGY